MNGICLGSKLLLPITSHEKNLFLTLKVGVLSLFVYHAKAQEIVSETEAAYNQRMKWFNDAQFGLFIHYGVYSNLAGEWKGEPVKKYSEWIQRWGKITPEEYIPLAADFKPENLDADLWVKTAREAGMKYMVITTKHHEGFCLWDSEHTEYDLGEATTFDRDILGELKVACDKYGIKYGTYYSIIDWHHPSQRAEQASNKPPMNDKAGYVKYMKAQLKELVDRYDPAIMWFDGDWTPWWTPEDGTDLYNYLRELSPEMIINNRVSKRALFKKDYGTPENSTPGATLDHFWEACWTINHSWGYKKSDQKWKSHTELVQKQIDINTKGGNLLLNIGPKGDGSWPAASFEQLKAMGEWNKAHHDAVYDTENAELPVQTWGRLSWSKASNLEKGDLYAYVFDWPSDGKLFFNLVSADRITATSYGDQPLTSTIKEKGIEVDVSSITPNEYVTVIKLNYDNLQKLNYGEVDLKLTGNELILQISDAMVKNQKGSKAGTDFIELIPGSASEVNWSLNVPAPSKYEVSILYSYLDNSSKAQVMIKVGGKTVKAKLKTTLDPSDYQLHKLGVVNLDQVGATKVKLTYEDMRERATFQVKTVIFTPVAE